MRYYPTYARYDWSAQCTELHGCFEKDRNQTTCCKGNRSFAALRIFSSSIDINVLSWPLFIHSVSCANAIWQPKSFSITFILCSVSFAAAISACRDIEHPFGIFHTANSSNPSKSLLSTWLIELLCLTVIVNHPNIPRMATITTKQYPLICLDVSDGTKISWHVPWGLDNPKTAVAKKVHGFFESSKPDPRTTQLFPPLAALHRVEVSAIPLDIFPGIFRREMSWRAILYRTRSKKRTCLGKLDFDRSTVIPVCVASSI